jgi:hypothetical protein
MAQIRGIINQTHRKQDLELIKNIYHSNSAQNLGQDDQTDLIEFNEESHNHGEPDHEDLSEDVSEDVSNNNNSRNWESTLSLWKRMLETEDIAFHEDEENEMTINDDRINDSIIEIANCIHPQRDNNAKWELCNLFIVDLEPPCYIGEL